MGECKHRDTVNLPSEEPPEAEQYCFVAVQSGSHLAIKGGEPGLFQRNSSMSQKLSKIICLIFL